jgi:uncharacterized membrane protein YciS (DUF1049 family)
LLSIGIYATAILFVKVVFGVGHQLKWMIFEKYCMRIKCDGERKDKISKYWKDSYEIYLNNIKDI